MRSCSSRPRVLVLTPFVPIPVAGGGGGTYYGLIRSLAKEFEIDLVCFTDLSWDQSDLSAIRSVCADFVVFYRDKARCYMSGLSGLLSGLPLRVGYCRDVGLMGYIKTMVASRGYSAVIASHERMAQYVVGLRVPVRVWDLVDVTCVRQKLIALTSSHVLRRLVAALDFFLIRSFERSCIRSFSETWVCTRQELLGLRAVTQRGDALVSRRGASTDLTVTDSVVRERRTVMFMGQLAYEPNADGLQWFCREIWPAILALAPDARLLVVGPSPPRWIRRAASAAMNIEVTGPVESVEPYLGRATALVCPLRIGTGVRIKILEAMAAGCPVVSTTVGFRGIDAVPGRDLAVADTPSDFAGEVLDLMKDSQAGVRMAASALRHVAPNYTPDAVAAVVAQRVRHLLSGHRVLGEAPDDLRIRQSSHRCSAST